MAFVKLDRDILRSTIWFDRAAREVFITALLLAEPQEFTEPVQQIQVGTLEPTGWIAPPGWYGFVAASGPGVVDASKVPFEEGMAALVRLGDPEPQSRSQEFEGRRMIRVNGGYVVLNFMKHRDKDHTSRFRSARYRDRLKATASRRDATEPTRDVTYARMPLLSASESSSSEGMQGEGPGMSKFAPEDFTPSHAQLVRCQELKFDVGDLVRRFRGQEFNRKYSNWSKRFDIWIEDQRVRRETEHAKALAEQSSGKTRQRGANASQSPLPGRPAHEVIAEMRRPAR